jgi:hypothetical protein
MLGPTQPSSSSSPLQNSSEAEENEDNEACLSEFAKWVSVVNLDTKPIQNFLPFAKPSCSLSGLVADWVRYLYLNSLLTESTSLSTSQCFKKKNTTKNVIK